MAPQREHTITFEFEGKVLDFQLSRKVQDLGVVAVDHYWMDKRQLYAQRGRRAQVLSKVLHFYWRECLRLDAFTDRYTCETYLLARLLPWVRTIGAQRVMADANLPRARPTKRGESEFSAKKLDLLLSQAPRERMSMLDFRDRTAEVLGPPDYSVEAELLYEKVIRELLDEPCSRLILNHDEAVTAVKNRWKKLDKQFGRRRGFTAEKQVLDVLSFEARAAYHRCYSLLWLALMSELHQRRATSEETSLFLAFWHTEICRPAAAGEGVYFRMFHGHIFGLHPATSLLIQTTTGRAAIGAWLVDPESDDRFEEMLHTVYLAIHYYSTARDDYNASRRGSLPSISPHLDQVDSSLDG